MIRCAHCPERHAKAAEVRDCAEAAYVFVPQEVLDAEAAAEIWAEGAWLRAAEAGTPDTWREHELERMSEASGLPIPPNYF